MTRRYEFFLRGRLNEAKKGLELRRITFGVGNNQTSYRKMEPPLVFPGPNDEDMPGSIKAAGRYMVKEGLAGGSRTDYTISCTSTWQDDCVLYHLVIECKNDEFGCSVNGVLVYGEIGVHGSKARTTQVA